MRSKEGPPDHISRRSAKSVSVGRIVISREPDGRLRIESTDTRALDRLEDLMLDLVPPPKDYKVFELKYALAYWVALELKDYFKDENDKALAGNRRKERRFGP